jgi:hypothetical protein
MMEFFMLEFNIKTTFYRSSLYAMSLIVLCIVFTATEIITEKVIQTEGTLF